MQRGTECQESKDDREAGYSLIELLVAMGIFAIVTAIFLSGIVSMTRSTVRASVTVDAAESVRRVFQRLDKQVRYSDGVNLPGTGLLGAQYVEFRTPATVAVSGQTMCTQWRWDPSTSLVQFRTWRASVAPTATWSTMATHVVNDTGVVGYPFLVNRATPKHPRQSLKLHLLLESTASSGHVSTASLFVARNTSIESGGNADTNADGVSDLPVCWSPGVRP
jgi:prepilin-type N-terminal cleavage/methylation domain-containing protein